MLKIRLMMVGNLYLSLSIVMLYNMELKGKIALITGATRGIGECIALRLASMGMRLVITGRDLDKLEKLKVSIQKYAPQPHLVAADITDPETPVRLIGETIQMFGGIDVLVNNAG